MYPVSSGGNRGAYQALSWNAKQLLGKKGMSCCSIVVYHLNRQPSDRHFAFKINYPSNWAGIEEHIECTAGTCPIRVIMNRSRTYPCKRHSRRNRQQTATSTPNSAGWKRLSPNRRIEMYEIRKTFFLATIQFPVNKHKIRISLRLLASCSCYINDWS